jgi:lipopolysaccharide transport system ATP-binding protein
MKPIIRVENLSKQYAIGGAKRESYAMIRDSLANAFRRPLDIVRRRRKKTTEENRFWALKDVSFEIVPGEVVGIIGRNGAGKSTLLKILSRITEPTEGRIELFGRVGSLLEVGTGFHPELTGGENIYLNGAILGMRREEIAKKFDEIVDFAEIESFLDTPVKHYSSGMYVRLAFAVAAHLEPEVLIVDEVLAVGDAEFQKKCLGKMNDVSRHGRTVLFVSHQMGTIAQLCKKAILLERGQIVMQDRAHAVIEHYVNQRKSKSATYAANDAARRREMFVKAASVTGENGVEQTSFRHDQAIAIRVECGVNNFVRGTELRMVVRDARSITIFTSDVELNVVGETSKSFAVDFKIPANLLRPNSFSLTFAIFIPHQLIIELIEDALFFSVFDGGTKYALSEGMDYGVIFSPAETAISQNDQTSGL